MSRDTLAPTIPSFDLRGRGALVTGASEGGIGIHSALALGRAGAKLVVSDHPSQSNGLEATVRTLTDAGISATPILGDIADQGSIDSLVAEAETVLGGIDILAHHAGMMLRKPAFDTTIQEWQRVLDVNLTGTFIIDTAVARGMVSRGHGKIINMSSVYAAIVGTIPEPAYYATKAGVANLTRGLAGEWGPSGVNVNCLAPGTFYPTRMTAALAADPDNLARMSKRTQLGRLGDPAHDIGGTVVWLASSASDYITGQVIYIDGGWSSN